MILQTVQWEKSLMPVSLNTTCLPRFSMHMLLRAAMPPASSHLSDSPLQTPV